MIMCFSELCSEQADLARLAIPSKFQLGGFVEAMSTPLLEYSYTTDRFGRAWPPLVEQKLVSGLGWDQGG